MVISILPPWCIRKVRSNEESTLHPVEPPGGGHDRVGVLLVGRVHHQLADRPSRSPVPTRSIAPMSPPTAPIAVVSWPSRSVWAGVHLDAERDAVLGARRDGQRWLLEGSGGGSASVASTSGPRSILPGVPRDRRTARDRAAAPDRRATASRTGRSTPCPDSIATADGLPHERPLRARGDDDEDARRGAAGPGGGGLGRAGQDLPPRARSPTYKANRQATPDLLREQSAALPAADGGVRLRQHRARRATRPTTCIGTLARRAEEAGEPVVILTGDRDAFQLVSPTGSASWRPAAASPTPRSTPPTRCASATASARS